MTAFRAMLTRELRLTLRGGGDMLTLVLFFVIVGAIVPFAVGPDQELLSRIAPGIVWIAQCSSPQCKQWLACWTLTVRRTHTFGLRQR